MPRKRVFSPSQEAEIARRTAAGESSHSIAKGLKTSPQNVQNAIKRVKTEVKADPSDIGPARDEFEAAQLAAFEVLGKRIRNKKTSARDLAGCVKAQNDTIKAIRQHRLLSRGGAGDEPDERVSDAVIAKLQRLTERSEAGHRALEPVAEVEEEPTGTE